MHNEAARPGGSKEQSWRTVGEGGLRHRVTEGEEGHYLTLSAWVTWSLQPQSARLGLCPSWFGPVMETDGKVCSSLCEWGQKFQACDPDFAYMFFARTMNCFHKEKKRKAVWENGVEKKSV